MGDGDLRASPSLVRKEEAGGYAGGALPAYIGMPAPLSASRFSRQNP